MTCSRSTLLGPSSGGRSPWGLAAAGTPRRSVAVRAAESSRGRPGRGARRRRVERHRAACQGRGARRQRGEQRRMAGWGCGAQRTVVVWGRGSASTAAVTCALARCGSYCRNFFYFYSVCRAGRGMPRPLKINFWGRLCPLLQLKIHFYFLGTGEG